LQFGVWSPVLQLLFSYAMCLRKRPTLSFAVTYLLTQEAQLLQRNHASTAHVYLGWLTDRAMHRTPQNRRWCTTIGIEKSYQLRKRPTYVSDEVF